MMQERSLDERVDALERKVDALETLPDRVTRVEFQLVQLRQEVRGGFAAIRGEVMNGDEETRRVLGDKIRTGDEETRRGDATLHARSPRGCDGKTHLA